jgi:hypothetical protein
MEKGEERGISSQKKMLGDYKSSKGMGNGVKKGKERKIKCQ